MPQVSFLHELNKHKELQSKMTEKVLIRAKKW